jgi:DNA (cytosine-5)-methyltransferase 1
MGYSRAGFEVVGVDINPQPRYPFEFIQADAMTFPLEGFDAIHASPPCQGYSIMNNLPWNRDRDYPLLLAATRERLLAAGVHYVIENVGGARYGAAGLVKRGLQEHGLKAGFLCGLMFGLPMYRHRYFETNWFWFIPGHPKHRLNLHPRSERAVYGGTVKGLPGGAAGLDVKPRVANPVNSGWQLSHNGSRNRNGAQAYGNGIGHSSGWRRAAELMGIDWMKREELTQAIPPAYTTYIGRELLRVVSG